MTSVSFSLSGMWSGFKATVSVAYKAAFLFLAYKFVIAFIAFIAFDGFFVEAALAFYKAMPHQSIT